MRSKSSWVGERGRWDSPPIRKKSQFSFRRRGKIRTVKMSLPISRLSRAHGIAVCLEMGGTRRCGKTNCFDSVYDSNFTACIFFPSLIKNKINLLWEILSSFYILNHLLSPSPSSSLCPKSIS
uniref:Uncharacterized protein n=1 Tax=Rousettus aegyptiacus TaxID=9407 RepID=A0A7J8KAP3_ROUAE|nr:hypothetical protein HJG63_007744 [Rousettus aegyptiacus]